jgi:hypothetical protein
MSRWRWSSVYTLVHCASYYMQWRCPRLPETKTSEADGRVCAVAPRSSGRRTLYLIDR